MYENRIVEHISFLDDGIPELLQAIHGKAFIAGGMARRIFRKDQYGEDEETADIDVYVYEGTDDALAAANTAITSCGYSFEEATPHAINYRKPGYLPVQIVNPVEGKYGEPEDVMGNFDFTVTQFAVESVAAGISMVFSRNGRFDVLRRKLRWANPQRTPPDLLYRLMKYFRKGYVMSPFDLRRIFREWEQWEPEDREAYLSAVTVSGDPSTIGA